MNGETTCDVLVVDDELDTCMLARKILELENFSVLTAINGEEALQLVQEQGIIPRVILLDLLLPPSGGFTVLETLKGDERFQSIKIIIFTAKNLSADIERAKELGADGYITKPFSGEGLVRKIREKMEE
ncbi:MAG TPA: response regulator [Candidatus Lokiarchaeia archaeon]|nr:response regulator [Candidatus Lokiarchaeia archaeon]